MSLYVLYARKGHKKAFDFIFRLKSTYFTEPSVLRFLDFYVDHLISQAR